VSKNGFVSSLDVEVIIIKISSHGKYYTEDLLRKVTQVSTSIEIQEDSVDCNTFIKIMIDTFNESSSEGTKPCQRIALDLYVVLEEYHSSYELNSQYIETGEVLEVINNLFKSEVYRRKSHIILKHKDNEAILKKAHEYQRHGFEEGKLILLSITLQPTHILLTL
jgi:hypothetical protein